MASFIIKYEGCQINTQNYTYIVYELNNDFKTIDLFKLVEPRPMLNYSFLLEADAVKVARKPTVNPLLHSTMGFNSVFKPFNIAGLNLKTRNAVMRETNYKLGSINILSARIQKGASNPENKNAQSDRIKLKYAQNAYKIHHEFVSKLIFWKSRPGFKMGPQFLQLKEQYTRSLFMLEQAYKRESLGLQTADTSNY